MENELDDIPPLEDMSHMLQEIDKIRPEKKIMKDYIPESKTLEVTSNPVVKTEKESVGRDKTVNTKSNSFGGMKKGFLFSSPKDKVTPVSKNKDSKCETMPYIKKTETNDELRINEVQDAMKAGGNLLQNKDWVNDDLLKEIEKNDVLYSKLSNPQFSAAIAEFQHNPEGAMKKYADNAEMQKFLKEFCGVMGNHFSQLAEKNPSNKTEGGKGPVLITQNTDSEPHIKSEDENRLEEILSSEKVKEVLMDEKIQNLFHTLKNNPKAGERILHNADGDFKRKIKVLIDAGLLQIDQR
ncbi:hypothetical protein LOTGIDRAFT_204592 [Lottia gigantea]|uniref:STI1/HOP DP domain-containing protein n=1 Tax=Lottia gigantea TaxID=225164 RepID=V3ZN59_LOTGI|nr:hypothetical protein LOTGIDRAFT_204592 [Lottia gigantea]ESO85762.1 hypothetical protein LOTGIDRAFT_204592 [Lottia gigantea]